LLLAKEIPEDSHVSSSRHAGGFSNLLGEPRLFWSKRCASIPFGWPGHRPAQLDKDNYLAGGTPFGPFITAADITPDDEGEPAGLSFIYNSGVPWSRPRGRFYKFPPDEGAGRDQPQAKPINASCLGGGHRP
jgi:hypothetical protein